MYLIEGLNTDEMLNHLVHLEWITDLIETLDNVIQKFISVIGGDTPST